jgi:hypothetical protein
MYQMIATLAAGTMPPHSHPQEQLVHILKVECDSSLTVPHDFQPAIRFISPATFRTVWKLFSTRVLDTFSPPRDDYLAIDEQRMAGVSDPTRYLSLSLTAKRLCYPVSRSRPAVCSSILIIFVFGVED